MKIITPLTNLDHFYPLVQAGAGEFFTGFIPFKWLEKYKTVNPINRREFLLGNFNFTTYSEMEILARMVDHYKTKVKITLNSHYYLPEQYDFIAELILNLKKIGFNSFIIADPALCVFLKNNNVECNLHISGEAVVINSHSIEFFYNLNAKRIVFPRKIPIEDMAECIKKSKSNIKEFECFVLNSLCVFTGGYCNSFHCNEFLPTCHAPYRLVLKKNTLNATINFDQKIIRSYHNLTRRQSNTFGISGCGVCRIKELKKIGVTHVKVVGRGVILKELIRDIKYLNEIIELSNDERIFDFKSYIKEHYFDSNCFSNLCYYKE